MRQENRAWKEISQVLKKGNIGRNLSARDFIRVRDVVNETIYALVYSKLELVSDFTENAEIIRDLGLPETSKVYKRIMEKYTNFELHDRFIRLQQLSSRVLRSESDAIKEIDSTFIVSEKREIGNKFSQLKYLNNRRKGKTSNPEIAQKIIKTLKKKGVKFVIDLKESTGYCSGDNVIYIQYKVDLKCPSTILHEYGHYLSDMRGEVSSGFYNQHRRYNLDESANTSHNLYMSIFNRANNLYTLMEEANASYHAAALEKEYGVTKEHLRASKNDLSNKFKSYELSCANEILIDNCKREIGRLRNK